MPAVKCYSQRDLDKAVKAWKNGQWIELWGRDGERTDFILRSDPQVHVEARESSHVEARGSSHVKARGSSHVVARESSHVEAWESSHVVASKFVPVQIHDVQAQVSGGVQIKIQQPANIEEWIDWYGARREGDAVILFKAVGDDYRSKHGMSYVPGTMPEAADWDGGKKECGGGLHFCPHPILAKDFDSEATRFVACPVKISEIAFHQKASYPNKIKAPRVCEPVWEVDRYGKAVVAVSLSEK